MTDIIENYEDFLISQINECEIVVNDLESSKVYQILEKDMQAKLKESDSTWHLADEKTLSNARINKLLAVAFFEIKKNYEEQLKTLKEQLKKYKELSEEERLDVDDRFAVELEKMAGKIDLSKIILRDWDNE